jgi:hypothetical protein
MGEMQREMMTTSRMHVKKHRKAIRGYRHNHARGDITLIFLLFLLNQ